MPLFFDQEVPNFRMYPKKIRKEKLFTLTFIAAYVTTKISNYNQMFSCIFIQLNIIYPLILCQKIV
jgi:hypothetical protein